MSPPVLLGPGHEFDRIRAIAEQLGDRAARLGDDCAALPPGAGTTLVSTDVSLDGVHFRRTWLEAREIGWRAAAAALSDLAPAGALPVGLLAALLVPEETDARELGEIMLGIGEAAASVGAVVLGGDLSRAPVLGAAITVLGRAEHPVGRAGSRPGDGLWVTGMLGGARSAVIQWERGESPDPASRSAFAAPVPRIVAGQWLARNAVCAMLDLSDGLAGDAGHLAAAGGVGLRIALERLPLHPGVERGAALAGEPRAVFAARGGEDYELLAVLPSAFAQSDAGRFRAETHLPLTLIGEVTADGEVQLLLGGVPQRLASWDHFA